MYNKIIRDILVRVFQDELTIDAGVELIEELISKQEICIPNNPTTPATPTTIPIYPSYPVYIPSPEPFRPNWYEVTCSSNIS